MSSSFDHRTLEQLTIDDEEPFLGVELYGVLKQHLIASGYGFAVLRTRQPRWDRALFLNLTFWSGQGDVLVDERLPADVVAHVAWHHLAARAVGNRSADAMFLGESIASAFDLYLVGRLLAGAPTSEFLETQVPAMAECATSAGLSKKRFAALLEEVAAAPERAFEDLRQLLFDVTTALVACPGREEAQAALARHEGHRFGPLLHHYELSNWVLYARAYAAGATAPDPAVRAVDAALRDAPEPLGWLRERWC